jgi:hypothetical protein
MGLTRIVYGRGIESIRRVCNDPLTGRPPLSRADTHCLWQGHRIYKVFMSRSTDWQAPAESRAETH